MNKQRWLGTVLATVLSGCVSANVTDRGNFGTFMRSLNDKSHGYTVVPDPTIAASGNSSPNQVERFEVRDGDCGANRGWSDCANDRERSELSERNKTTVPGQRYWYSWKIFFPEDYVNIYPTKVALGQFHQHKAHVVWMFQNADGGYYLDDQVSGRTRKYYPLISEEDLRGRWHKVEIDAKWSTSDDGWFRVWINGEQKVDYAGQTMQAKAVYFKYGLYRSFVSRYKKQYSADTVPTQVVYFKDVARADSRDKLPE